MSHKQLVFVGLSGGVDSSVAALRLLRQGYRVVGVFIKVWHPTWLSCNWEQERLDAMRVAAALDIPFLTCDAEEAYKRGVADYFISEYLRGRTPNPDVMCNQQVKFGAFLNFALHHGADMIATGHYAQKTIVGETQQLLRGVDESKDQSYFLWTLTQEQLSRTLFPVGNSTKDAIRDAAAGAGLSTAKKPDSQGICFLGQVNIPEFLAHYTTLEQGAVLGEKGVRIGTHVGALVYTVGQRHGFTVNAHSTLTEPHYVVARDLETNTITVSTKRPALKPESKLVLTACNWISEKPVTGAVYEVQIRYRQTPFKVQITNIAGDTTTLIPLAETDLPSSGQSGVLYNADVCIGGGIIA